jgi:Fe-S-cluster-containing dehydrogenase component/DMSO reductase anchor subunit
MAKIQGFIFDYSKCVGCHACMVACYAENSTKPPLSWRQVSHYNRQKLPLLGFIHLSIACNHCQEAPCLKACPSGAYTIDKQTNAVIHIPEFCIGCKYCIWACPFDAPKYNPEAGIVEKCNFCNHRLANGEIPACALNCPTGALSFGEIGQKSNPEAFGLSSKEIFPRIKVLNTNVVDCVPVSDISLYPDFDSLEKKLLHKDRDYLARIAKEWPLAIFTFIGSILTGWIFATLLPQSLPINSWLFLLLGILGIVVSTLHLGKPLRAYLSIKNIRSSWLSREIFLFGLFMLSAFGSLMLGLYWLTVVASIFGLLFLFSIEKLYSITKYNFITPIHSANTFAIALIFAALFAQEWNLLIAFLAIKTMIFTINNGVKALEPSPQIALFSLVRLVVGFIVPFGLLVLMNEVFSWVLLLSIILGELIDRLMFYGDFMPEKPFDKTPSKSKFSISFNNSN